MRKALIDLDWLDARIDTLTVCISQKKMSVIDSKVFKNELSRLKLVRSKCEPVEGSKEKEMLSLLQRMYDEYSMNERITGSLLKFMIEARELIKKAKQLN